VVLAVTSELEAWLGSESGREQLVVAVAGPLLAGTVAVRRRYPAAAGIAAALIAEIAALGWRAPSTVSFGIAWVCSMYALTASTTSNSQRLPGQGSSRAPCIWAFVDVSCSGAPMLPSGGVAMGSLPDGFALAFPRNRRLILASIRTWHREYTTRFRACSLPASARSGGVSSGGDRRE